LFGFEAYHILLAALGLSIILSFWLPRFISGREPATSALLIMAGLVTFTFIPGMPEAIGPVEHPRQWELLAELCVIVGLFGTGLRIDRLAGRKQWLPTLRLLLIAMPATILMLAIAGWAVAGMTLAGGRARADRPGARRRRAGRPAARGRRAPGALHAHHRSWTQRRPGFPVRPPGDPAGGGGRGRLRL
jgi:hypothetical protein